MKVYLQLLRNNPDFARLWVAQVISLLGDWFNTIALAALVSRYSDGSGLAVSGLLLARFLPPLLVSPAAGVLIDRFDRRRVLIISDLLRAVIVLLMLLATGPEHLWLIYGLTVVQFSLSALFEPGRSAIMPSLVKPADLLAANTLGNVTWSVMLAVGAMAGGAVAALLGTAAALVIDAASFALSAWFVASIRTRQEVVPAAEGKPHGSGSLGEGVRFVLRRPDVAALLFIKLGLSIGSTDAILIAYGTTLFVLGDGGTGSLGILYSAFGLGAILGPLLLNRFSDGSVRVMRRLVLVGFVFVVAGWLLIGAAPTLGLAAAAFIIRAMGGSVNWTYSSTMIQMSVPDAMLGRVFSFDWVGFYLMTAISTLVTGLLVDTLGGSNAFLIALGAGVIGLLPLTVWAFMTLRLERRPVEPPAVIPGGFGD